MTARRIRIGNTRSVRLAKPLLEEAGPSDDVEIRAEHGAVIITSVVAPPAGWAEAAARCEPERVSWRIADTRPGQAAQEPLR